MNSEERKGVVARATACMQWLRTEWETDAGKTYFIILGLSALTACALFLDTGQVSLITFGIGWVIAWLVKHLIDASQKLNRLRYTLLDIAFHKCRCNPDEKGYCPICQSRKSLEEHFPGAIEKLIEERLNAFEFEESYIPEDLAASYITPEALAYLRERRLDRVGPERFVPLQFTVRKLRK